mmetsp:Transcript_17581/g.47924  ORF Transcript_17581/g.47924 Transcript_17581/m.47924 type:complete len:247 (+) Transcript_17581:196-936(+)
MINYSPLLFIPLAWLSSAQGFSLGAGKLAVENFVPPPLADKVKACAVASTFFFGASALGLPSAAFAEEDAVWTSPPAITIKACPKATSGKPNNCVSTASVRQLDNFMAPWTYPKGMPTTEVVARIKGAVSTNNRLEVLDQTDTTLQVQAIRNFCTDQIQFLINPEDRVITFVSQQVDGPDGTPDFGENRKRLEDIRRRAGVFNVMGSDIEDAYMAESPRQGAFGQLKAFYGIQSGRGFEDVLLDDE